MKKSVKKSMTGRKGREIKVMKGKGKERTVTERKRKRREVIKRKQDW